MCAHQSISHTPSRYPERLHHERTEHKRKYERRDYPFEAVRYLRNPRPPLMNCRLIFPFSIHSIPENNLFQSTATIPALTNKYRITDYAPKLHYGQLSIFLPDRLKFSGTCPKSATPSFVAIPNL